jgi:glycosyltransferase involved in cell wall biosynthesis
MTVSGGIAVIFWGPHSNCTENFARCLDAPYYPIHYLAWKRPWVAPIKYVPMAIKTFVVLLQQRPKAVFVVNTPVFAPLVVYLYCRLAGVPYVMNVHGTSFIGRRWGWCEPLMRFLARRALVNLVGFSEYERLFESWGARAMILEDPLPDMAGRQPAAVALPDQFNVTFVNTFAGDEPLEPVLEAARLQPDVRYYVLGSLALADKTVVESAPPNVVFTDYLKGDAYWNRIFSSHVVLTLTMNPLSLEAGGLEGMIAGRPLVLSRTPVLVEYFTKGTVFVEHTAASIAASVEQARAQERTLTREIRELAQEKRAGWNSKFGELVTMMGAG